MIRLWSLILLLVVNSSAFAKSEVKRIITAGGSITEVVYLLGAGDQVIAVDQSSTYPPEIKSMPSVGYWKQLNAEGILSLSPTHLITWSDAEPASVLKQVEAMNVNLVSLERLPSTPEQLFINIGRIAEVLNKTEKGQALIDRTKTRLDVVSAKLAEKQDKPKVLFLLSVASGPAQVAGKNTIADGIVTLAGGHNLATHQNYQTYGAEAFIASNPDIIVLTTQALESLGGIEKLGKVGGVSHTNAWKNQRIVHLDQAILLGMGPRVADAVEGLYQGFYPDN